MDTVLGVSMAPTAVRMVLVEGENADGATVDEEGFDVSAADAPTLTGPEQVISAILGTREGAAETGYRLRSTGVTWTDPGEAAALRDALAARKVENVMLVSAFLAAAALAQVVGSSVGHAQTALLFVEPDTATLAVVDTGDGSISDVRRQPLRSGDRIAELSAMASGAETLATRPDGLFVVGSGVDVAPIKARLAAATGLAVSAPEEPETALARGAALASANAPLFSSSTAALAYAQDPGTGAIDPYAVSPGYFDVAADARSGEQALAYSAVPDADVDEYTAVADEPDFVTGAYTGAHTGVSAAPTRGGRKPVALVASAVAAIFVIGAVALLVALAVSMRPTAGVRSNPGQNVIAPSKQAPAPAPPPAAPAPAPAPAAAPPAPAPAPAAPAPEPAAPAPAPAPAAAVPAAPAPAAPAPAPEPAAPAPAPAPVAPAPAAPAPAPVAPAPPVAPIPVPVPIPLPRIFSPPMPGPPLQPRGGDHGGGGWGPGGGGFPGGGGHGGDDGFPGGGDHGGGGWGPGGFPGHGGHDGGGFPGGGFGGGHGGFGGGHGGGHGHGGGFGIPGLGF
jgi:hypothetical protein